MRGDNYCQIGHAYVRGRPVVVLSASFSQRDRPRQFRLQGSESARNLCRGESGGEARRTWYRIATDGTERVETRQSGMTKPRPKPVQDGTARHITAQRRKWCAKLAGGHSEGDGSKRPETERSVSMSLLRPMASTLAVSIYASILSFIFGILLALFGISRYVRALTVSRTSLRFLMPHVGRPWWHSFCSLMDLWGRGRESRPASCHESPVSSV